MKELAKRFNEGKTKWSLLDFDGLEGMVRVLMYGAKKYDPDNWKKGRPIKDTFDSFFRHYHAFINGENLDPESGLPHIDHMLCNIYFIAYYLRNVPEMDDRTKRDIPNISVSQAPNFNDPQNSSYSYHFSNDAIAELEAMHNDPNLPPNEK